MKIYFLTMLMGKNIFEVSNYLPLVTTPLIKDNKLKMAEWNDFNPSWVVNSCWYLDPHSLSSLTMLLTYKIRLNCSCDGDWGCSISTVIIVDAVCSKLKPIHFVYNWVSDAKARFVKWVTINYLKMLLSTAECSELRHRIDDGSVDITYQSNVPSIPW